MAYTRKIYLGGNDFSDEVDKCSFTWDQKGCAKASLGISSADFDDLRGLAAGVLVEVKENSSDRWWKGFIEDIQTSLTGGLSITAHGMRYLLAEPTPTGRFGTIVETAAPTALEAAAEANANSELAADTYRYAVTSIDDDGETWTATRAGGQSGGTDGNDREYASVVVASGEQAAITWDEANGANAYRVYRVPDALDFTAANGCVYFETSELEYDDDGSSDGTAADFPFTASGSSTQTTPTISDTDVQTVVKHLLDTYTPGGITYSAANVTAGADEDLDDYDLTRSSAKLDKILDALAAIVGDTHWYVDEDAAIHFKPLSESITYTYRVYREGTDVSASDTNVVVGATKALARDGTSSALVEGEEIYADPDQGTREISTAWDSTTESAASGDDLVNVDPASTDYRYIVAGLTPIASNDLPPLVTSTNLAYLDSYATMQDWLDAYPGYRWLWFYRAQLSSDFITRALSYLRIQVNRIREWYSHGGLVIPGGPVGYVMTSVGGYTRPRTTLLRLPGITTGRLGGQAAMNRLITLRPNPAKWSIKLEQVDTLIKPGRGFLRFTTSTGNRYDIEIFGVSFAFGESVSATITAGTRTIEPEEETAEVVSTVSALVARPVHRNVWRPNSDDVAV